MLTTSHGFAARLTGIAIAASFAAGALLVTSGAEASGLDPAQEQVKEKVEKVRKFVVLEGTPGARDHELRMKQCEGEPISVSDESGTATEKKRMFINLCPKKGATKAELAEMVDKAVTRIETSDDMDAETKAKIVAKLRAKLTELR